MEITIFMGNGFDRGAGLETSYSNFRDYLLTVNEDHSRHPGELLIINSIKSNPPSRWHNCKLWSDFELGLGEYASYFTPSRFKTEMSSIGKSFKEHKAADVYWEGVMYVLDKLSRYLKGVSDNCTKQLSPLGLTEFAQWIVDPAYFFEGSEKHEIQHICHSHSNERWNINFWSLNYTALLEQCIRNLLAAHSSFNPLLVSPYKNEDVLLNSTVEYLHGNSTDQVCGVGCRKQIKNSRFILRKKTQKLIKKYLVLSKDRKHRSYETVRSSISSSDLIYIYGTSLGESDIWLWRQICKWLRCSKEHHLFIYVYNEHPPLSAQAVSSLKEKQYNALFKGGVRIHGEDLKRIHIKIHDKTEIVHDAWFVDPNAP